MGETTNNHLKTSELVWIRVPRPTPDYLVMSWKDIQTLKARLRIKKLLKQK